MITVNPQHVKHYCGTPYVHAAPADVLPGNREDDQSPLWFAFTPDYSRMIVGGVASEAQLISILQDSAEMDAALSHIL